MNELTKLCHPIEIGKRLQIAMIKRNLSRMDLARLLETNGPMISQYQNGKVMMRLDKAIVVSAVCNISLDELITGKPEGVWQQHSEEK